MAKGTIPEVCGKLESVDGKEDKRASGSLYNLIFGHAPSQSEVENAIDALQKFFSFMLGKSSSGSELKWLQQNLDGFDPRMLLSHGYRRVYDAFQLLQKNSAVKRLVVSLSSDKAVWDAVMKNEVVQKLRESPYTAYSGMLQSSNEEPDLITFILRLILDVTKTKIMELIEKFLLLVNELFQPPEKENRKKGNKDQLEENLRSSFLLSVLILLIVVVARVQIV